MLELACAGFESSDSGSSAGRRGDGIFLLAGVPPELGRSHAEFPPELAAEIEGVAEAELKRDLLDRETGPGQQFAGGFHPALHPVTVGRLVHLRPEEPEFFLTYGDGVADIDLAALLALHRREGKLLTVSAVHPEGRFGEMQISGDTVSNFEEKPVQAGGFINGGFMVMKREFVKRHLTGDDAFLEQRPMYEAAQEGNIAAYRHESFWQCMDTPREYALLNHLWETGRAPWTKFWKHA